MQKTLKFLGFKVGALVAVNFFILTALGLAAAPRIINFVNADSQCNPTFDRPIFNPYRIANTGEDCTEWSFMRARVNGGAWQADTDNNQISAQPGDEVEFILYVHNGAIENGDPNITTARDVQLATNVNTTSGTSHQVSAQVTASNAANALNGWMFVNTPSDTKLEVVAGSEHWDQRQSFGGSLPGMVNNTVRLPDQLSCFQYVRYIFFKVKVVSKQVTPPPAQLTCSPANTAWPLNTGGSTPVITFTAQGGSGNYTWSAPGAITTTGSGSSFNTNFTSAGNFTVTVTSDGQSAACAVNVTQQQVPAQPSASITASLGSQVASQCLWNGNVTWSTANVNNVRVYVKSSSHPAEQLFAADENGNRNVDWIGAGDLVTFILRGDNIPDKTAVIDARDKSCGVTPPPPSAQPTASISAQLGSQVAGQCLWTGTVTWNTTNVNNVRIYVRSNSRPVEQLFAADISGNRTVDWIGAGDLVTFVLRGDNISEKYATIDARDKSCGVTPPPPPAQPSATITASLGSKIAGQCLWNGNVTWSTANVNNVRVYVKANNGTEQLFAADENGNRNVDWIGAGDYVVFILRGDNIPDKTAVIDARGQTCAAPAVICVLNSASVITGSVTNVSELVSYSVQSPVSGQQYNWTAANGTPFAGQGATFATRFNAGVTSGVVSVNGIACPPIVINIPQPPQPLSCFASPSSAQVNGEVTFTALGGTGSYSWSVPGSTGGTPVGNTFAHARYAAPGTKTATVTSGNQQASCNVQITQQPQICVVNTGAVLYNTAPVLNGSLYSTVISWQSSGGNQISITRTNPGSSLETVFAGGGASGQQTANGLQPGASYTFNMYDVNCNQLLKSLTVVLPGLPVTPPPPGGNTNTYNTCVNNSCNNTNTYYYYSSVSTPVPANEYLQLGITKAVRNASSGSPFQKTAFAGAGDTVQFQITVTNTGNRPVNNVVLTDGNVSGLSWLAGTTNVAGGSYYGGYSNSWSGNNLNLGTLGTGQSATVTFQARVNAVCGTSIQNVASVSGDGVPYRQDDAWVFLNPCGNVQGANISLAYSKRAWNDSKNIDATRQPASKEDFITYTLTVTNNGNQPAANFVITDDLSQVLPYADMVDNGGGSVSGNVITYPGITVPAGGSVSRSFRVRVKYFLAENLNYTMTNTYGNTVVVNINAPRVAGAFVAPKTGAETNAFVFSGLMVAAFAVAKKRETLLAAMKMIFG